MKTDIFVVRCIYTLGRCLACDLKRWIASLLCEASAFFVGLSCLPASTPSGKAGNSSSLSVNQEVVF